MEYEFPLRWVSLTKKCFLELMYVVGSASVKSPVQYSSIRTAMIAAKGTHVAARLVHSACFAVFA